MTALRCVGPDASVCSARPLRWINFGEPDFCRAVGYHTDYPTIEAFFAAHKGPDTPPPTCRTEP